MSSAGPAARSIQRGGLVMPSRRCLPPPEASSGCGSWWGGLDGRPECVGLDGEQHGGRRAAHGRGSIRAPEHGKIAEPRRRAVRRSTPPRGPTQVHGTPPTSRARSCSLPAGTPARFWSPPGLAAPAREPSMPTSAACRPRARSRHRPPRSTHQRAAAQDRSRPRGRSRAPRWPLSTRGGNGSARGRATRPNNRPGRCEVNRLNHNPPAKALDAVTLTRVCNQAAKQSSGR